jgi:cytidylate kinase
VIITIDGPAGSGKSTVAREVAKRLGMRYLDTGALYRTVTLLALEAGLVPDRIPEAAELAASADIRLQERENDLSRVFVGDREVSTEIRGPQVSQHVSAVSADAGVRAVLTKRQRQEAERGDLVLEGRDAGTVVVPDADLKVFLTASIDERARRRQLQLRAQRVDLPLEDLIKDIARRDAYDSSRAVAPLRKADDAVEIDTTGMTVSQVVEAVCRLAEERRAASGPVGEATVTDVSGGRVAAEAGEAAVTDVSAADAVTTGAPLSPPPPKWRISRLVRSPHDTFLWRFAYSFLPPLWRLLFRMKIKGREHFPLAGAVLLASNHRSNLDPFFLGVASPRQIHFMAKAELWKVGLLGRVIEALGAFPVNRGEADRAAVRRALELLDSGAVVGLFPEGHRQRDGGLGVINPGVSLFALREGVTTVPVVIQGSERILRGKRLRLPRVSVTFGSPLRLPAADLPRAERSQVVAAELRAAYLHLLQGEGRG